MSAAHTLNGNNSDTYYKSLYYSERIVSNTLKAKCDSLKPKAKRRRYRNCTLDCEASRTEEKKPSIRILLFGPAFMVFFVLLMLGLMVV